MYQTHFGLREGLFDGGIATDAAVYRSAKHDLVTAYFKLALTSPEAAVMLFGPPGIGKTTLVASALRAMSTRLALVFIGTAPANGNDLLELLLTESGLNAHRATRVERLQMWRQFVNETAATDSRLFVVVERTEDQSLDVLRSLDGLTAADPNGNSGANLVLLGRPGLDEFLAAPALDSLRQRVRVRQELEPFTLEETTEYVRHAVARAGGDLDRLFAPGTLAAVHRFTGGVARLINNLCETASSLAATKGQNQLSPELVARVATGLLGLEDTAAVVTAAAPVTPSSTSKAVGTPMPPAIPQAPSAAAPRMANPAREPTPAAPSAPPPAPVAPTMSQTATAKPSAEPPKPNPKPGPATGPAAAPTSGTTPRETTGPGTTEAASGARPTPPLAGTPSSARESAPMPVPGIAARGSTDQKTAATRASGAPAKPAGGPAPPKTPPSAPAKSGAPAPATPPAAAAPSRTPAASAGTSRTPAEASGAAQTPLAAMGATGAAAAVPSAAAASAPTQSPLPGPAAESAKEIFDGAVTDVAIEDEIDPPLLTDAVDTDPTVPDLLGLADEPTEDIADLDPENPDSFEAAIEAELLAALEPDPTDEGDVEALLEATDAVEQEPVAERPDVPIQTAYVKPKENEAAKTPPPASRQKEKLNALSTAKSIDDISSSMAETLFGDADLDMFSAALASAGWPDEAQEPTAAPAAPKRTAAPRTTSTVDDSFNLFDPGDDSPLELLDESSDRAGATPKRVSR